MFVRIVKEAHNTGVSTQNSGIAIILAVKIDIIPEAAAPLTSTLQQKNASRATHYQTVPISAEDLGELAEVDVIAPRMNTSDAVDRCLFSTGVSLGYEAASSWLIPALPAALQ